MNHTDSVPTYDREAYASDCATEASEMAIYEKLKDLFGVQGENLAFWLENPAPPSPFDTIDLMRNLRAAYRKRVAADACRMMEGN
jgi:hypothetical protein